ncbi:MAG: hypothetical protein NTZ35_13820 [Ignavibacteriales bacterium]|nr:hypothetical protein [Ignavibacteriales bacterium]
MISPRKTRFCIVCLFALLVLLFGKSVAQHQSSRSPRGGVDVVIVWNQNASARDSIDQESYAAMMASMGFTALKINVHELNKAELNDRTLLLVPAASSRSLSLKDANRIVRKVEKGLRLVTGGESPLLSALHFQLGKPHRVGVVLDHHLPANHLHWADRPRVKWIAALPDLPTEVLYADSSTGHPLVVAAKLGRGKYIVLAPHLDAVSGKGYSRFPTMVNAIVRNLDCTPSFRRRGVDAYFDPGYRFGMSIEELTARWRRWGIRAVHAAAWYSDSAHPYDYKKLIDAAHKNGILVYAWLEWPHVGQGFWNQHPEWRQKNALLQDARLDFLHLMDLQNPDCMNAALNDLSRQMDLDWDGVDIAEFTITGAGGEALEGPSRPDYFTSFGTPMRTEFARVGGFDPLELENKNSEHFWQRDSLGLEKFYQYRKVVNNRLLRRVVEFIVDLEKKGKRDWELIHTIVDNTLHPEFDHLLGFDLDATLALLKEFGITLNVEDPYMEWAEPPTRYGRLRRTLVSMIPEHSSMIDINVVPIHPMDQHGFPSEQATGTELLQQVQSAAERNGRVCFYCESSLFEQDWPLVPHVLAGGSTIQKSAEGWEVNVPATVTLDWGMRGLSPVVDGKPWPCFGDDGIILSPGAHQLSFAKRSKPENSDQQPLRLVDIAGELIECQQTATGLNLIYVSPSRCLVTFGSLPKHFLLDDSTTDLPVLKGAGKFILLAPSGRHRLSVQAP